MISKKTINIESFTDSDKSFIRGLLEKKAERLLNKVDVCFSNVYKRCRCLSWYNAYYYSGYKDEEERKTAIKYVDKVFNIHVLMGLLYCAFLRSEDFNYIKKMLNSEYAKTTKRIRLRMDISEKQKERDKRVKSILDKIKLIELDIEIDESQAENDRSGEHHEENGHVFYTRPAPTI